MNKFCVNCGEKLNENADFCVNCGIGVNKNIPNKKQPGKGLGIASMTLGIISLFDAICALFIFTCLYISEEYFLFEEKIALGIIFLIFPITLLIIGESLGIASRCKINNGFNLTGILLNSISLFICLLSIVIIYVI